ncbi:MAG: 2-oxo acid dehydrogenase subunit E2, partial [Nitriliruptor sp.]
MSDIRDFALPDLGEGLEDGEIVRWHVEVGDLVSLNDPVAEVETAKAVVDVPCPFAGRVVERLGEEGDTVPVGAVLVRIDVAEQPDGSPAGDGGDAPSDAEQPDGGPSDEPAPVEEAPAARASTGLDADDEPQPLVGYGQSASRSRRRRRRAADTAADAATGAPPTKPLAKPPVRKLAQDLGVDLAALAPGSGPEGSITRAEVEAAAAAPAPTPPGPASDAEPAPAAEPA